MGLLILATLPFSGPLLATAAGVTAASASTVAAVGTAVTAAGMAVAGGGLIVAAVSNGGSKPTKVGRDGERQAGINSSKKTQIVINNRSRIPDRLTSSVLTEVKNVKYLANILQLRDYAAYAKQEKLDLELIVRKSTKVLSTVKNAGWNILYILEDLL